MIVKTKHLIIAFVRDPYVDTRHRALFIYAIRRRNCPECETAWRFRLLFSLFREPPYRPLRFCLATIPAWSEVPSVRAEYERTMKPFEFPRTPWYLLERRNAVN
jgi:hypothetical protein